MPMYLGSNKVAPVVSSGGGGGGLTLSYACVGAYSVALSVNGVPNAIIANSVAIQPISAGDSIYMYISSKSSNAIYLNGTQVALGDLEPASYTLVASTAVAIFIRSDMDGGTIHIVTT